MRRSSMRYCFFATAICSMLLSGGCLTTSEGIDLSQNGVLDLVITRESESAVATATAVVSNSDALSGNIILADDQIISVNGVALSETTRTSLGLDATFAATISAANPPSTYLISFDNQGVLQTAEITPPESFESVLPKSSTVVLRSEGLDLYWSPADENGTSIAVSITGLVVSYAQDGTAQQTSQTGTLNDIADDGHLFIDSSTLSSIIAGDMTVTLKRTKNVSRQIGFASGTISMSIVQQINLKLSDATEMD